MSGRKDDYKKPPLNLIPFVWLEGVARVLAFGAKKYGEWNWTEGFAWSRLIGAAERHLGAWKDGEDADPETGESHLLHLSCEAMFLYLHERFGLGEDDRKKWPTALEMMEPGNSPNVRAAGASIAIEQGALTEAERQACRDAMKLGGADCDYPPPIDFNLDLQPIEYGGSVRPEIPPPPRLPSEHIQPASRLVDLRAEAVEIARDLEAAGRPNEAVRLRRAIMRSNDA